ncbi:hypothetical protein N7505_004412 [Penicillium chrysogenum]|uniref:Uncharacterized protein n=1 Tax=Penicillium chrysogenum TaxID=5076 RepID=A0ABQ8WF46_PENCH|nr:hypothetical protein N7505_004412 [Penicillium chrysogenum]
MHYVKAESEALTNPFQESLPTVLDLKCISIVLVTLETQSHATKLVFLGSPALASQSVLAEPAAQMMLMRALLGAATTP